MPGLRAGWIDTDRSGGAGGAGGSSTVVVNPIVDLQRDLTLAAPVEVMRVRTTDPNPDYLRMVTLDVFDGTSWRPSRMTGPVAQRVARGLPAPLGLDTSVPTTTVRTRVRVTRLDVPWLPLPYPATGVDVRGDWRYDRVTRVVFSTRTRTRDLLYVAVSRKVLPLRAVLDAAAAPAGAGKELQLPPDLPRVLPELATAITARSTTAYRRAVALQDWFRTQFAYDTTVAAGHGTDALLGFLADRRGYCEQFAATMALMARALGIPARVAVGFTPGARTPDGTWSVTTRDAHAWPELYFPGVGWTRFEPTPRGDGRAVVPAYSLPSSPDAPAAGRDAAPSGAPAASGATDPRPGRSGGHPRDERTPTDGGDGPRAGLPVLPVLGLGLLVALATPATADRVARRRRWSRPRGPAACARAGWDEVHRAAVDFGFGLAGADSPRAAARRLAAAARLGPDDAAALARLAYDEELARYGRPGERAPITPAECGRARADAALVRAALGRRVAWPRRWRARAFPPALLAEARTVAAGRGRGERGAGRHRARTGNDQRSDAGGKGT